VGQRVTVLVHVVLLSLVHDVCAGPPLGPRRLGSPARRLYA
jgi:hypothetical protein